jgi:Family of unknown function (DUF6496)
MPRYSKKAAEKVERAMHERKRGTLRSGGSGKKVASRKQAIAIGLSEARQAGARVPARKKCHSRSGNRSRPNLKCRSDLVRLWIAATQGHREDA